MSACKNIEQENPGLMPALAAALFLCFTLFVFGPVELYIRNLADLWFGLSKLWPGVVACGAVAFLGLLVLARACNRFASRFYWLWVAALTGLALAVYVQGNLLNYNAAMLEGHAAERQAGRAAIGWNSLAWLVMLALPFLVLRFRRTQFPRLVTGTGLGLTLIQAGTLASLLLVTPLDKNDLYFSTEKRFELSARTNIVVLLVDSVGTEYFEEVREKNPEYLEQLDGFTYFPDMVGSFRKTAGAFSFLLTGRYYLNEQPVAEFCKTTFAADTFWRELKALDYDIRIQGNCGGITYIPRQTNVFDNLVDHRSVVSSYPELVKTMLRLVGFRYAPVLLKPFFHEDFFERFGELKKTVKGQPPFFAKNDVKFYDQLRTERLTARDGPNAFRLFFLNASHVPYQMNEMAQAVPTDSVGYYPQTLGTFRILGEYLGQMKQLGLYDSGTILILADHAQSQTPRQWIKRPLFMLKPPFATGPLRISRAPASHADFRATVMQAAGGDEKKYGTSVLDLTEGMARERKYYCYSWTKVTGFDFFFDPIYEFIVSGDAANPANFKLSGKAYTKDGILAVSELPH